MKAAVIHEFGDFDVLKVEDVRTPKPRHGHVLVKVLAAGINRLDDYIRGGSIVPDLPFPHVLGADAAGEVFEMGNGVTGLAVGERVIVVPGYATEDADADIRPTVTAPSFALPGLHIGGTGPDAYPVDAYDPRIFGPVEDDRCHSRKGDEIRLYHAKCDARCNARIYRVAARL